MTRVRRQAEGGAARKSSPIYLKSDFKIGDRVRVLDIPEDLKDATFDAKRDDGEEWKMRTGTSSVSASEECSRFTKFGRYGHVELWVGRNRDVRRFGSGHSIEIGPEFLKKVGVTHLKPKRKNS